MTECVTGERRTANGWKPVADHNMPTAIEPALKCLAPHSTEIIDPELTSANGLEFDKEDEDHWIVIVNRRMHKDELLLKLIALAREWRALGRFQRDG